VFEPSRASVEALVLGVEAWIPVWQRCHGVATVAIRAFVT
jgi:hypothetical protein